MKHFKTNGNVPPLVALSVAVSLLVFLGASSSPAGGSSNPDATQPDSPAALLKRCLDASTWTNNCAMNMEIVPTETIQDASGNSRPAPRLVTATVEYYHSSDGTWRIVRHAPNTLGNFDVFTSPTRRLMWLGRSDNDMQGLVDYTESPQLIRYFANDPLLPQPFLDGSFLDGLDRINVATPGSGIQIKELDPEDVNSLKCRVVTWAGNGATCKVWVAPERGYNFVKYTFADPHFGTNILVKDVKFIQSDRQWFISGGTSVEIAQLFGITQTLAQVITRTDIDLAPDFAASGAFDLHWIPNGVKVDVEDWDARRQMPVPKQPKMNYVWQDGKPVPATGNNGPH